MTDSPFKFLDPYTLDDRHLFFGRNEEVEELYKMVFQADLVIVYGQSGTGKTSLIQCGLAGKFKTTDWLSLNIRRKYNINQSLRKTVDRAARQQVPADKSIVDRLQSLYLDYFKPIYLIFDQFEELLILGDRAEQQEFYQAIRDLLDAELNITIIIVLREEYVGSLYKFEEMVPELFQKRLRVEPMSRPNVSKVITGTCGHYDIALEPQEETVDAIINQVSEGQAQVQLTYLQMYLDRLWEEAKARETTTP